MAHVHDGTNADAIIGEPYVHDGTNTDPMIIIGQCLNLHMAHVHNGTNAAPVH